MQQEPTDYVIEVHSTWEGVSEPEWDALWAQQALPTPFMRYAYLASLQASGSATAETGWDLRVLCLRHQGQLLAACPLYLKNHSYGEYVFDWAWADAYRRAGLDYYPKLVSGIPYTPSPGPRLLVRRGLERETVAPALIAAQAACNATDRAVQTLAGVDRIHPADLWGAHWRWQPLAAEAGVVPRAADDGGGAKQLESKGVERVVEIDLTSAEREMFDKSAGAVMTSMAPSSPVNTSSAPASRATSITRSSLVPGARMNCPQCLN